MEFHYTGGGRRIFELHRSTLDITRPGWAIIVSMAILLALGISSIYVTDTHYASGHDGPRNAARQVVAVCVSAILGIAVLRISYQRIAPYAYFAFASAVLLLIIPLVGRYSGSTLGGLAAPRNGAFRWIHLPGFQLQPSEIMKVTYILAMAWYLRYRSNYRRFTGLLLPFILTLIPAALILLQPDLGMVLLLVPVLFAMLFMAGARISHLMMIALLGVAAAPLAWNSIHGYQRARITAVLLQSEALRKSVIENPDEHVLLATRRQAMEWAAGSGYQLVQSKNAIGSGGLWGHGLGKGIYVEHQLLPDRHNDFVFAVVAHQWGFWGCMVVIACYSTMVVSGAVIATSTPEPFARLLAVGAIALTASQAIINIGMAVGLMPITGMTLPFVSYGGSSILTNTLTISLLISVAQHRPFLLSTKPLDPSASRRERTPFVEVASGM